MAYMPALMATAQAAQILLLVAIIVMLHVQQKQIKRLENRANKMLMP